MSGRCSGYPTRYQTLSDQDLVEELWAYYEQRPPLVVYEMCERFEGLVAEQAALDQGALNTPGSVIEQMEREAAEEAVTEVR